MDEAMQVEEPGAQPPLPPPLLVDQPAAPKRRRSYFMRHWCGELDLSVSFWLNTVGINLLLGAIALGNAHLMPELDDPRPGIVAEVLMAMLWQLIFVWQAGGVIRSARRFRRETGFRFLPFFAVGLMIFSAVAHAKLLVRTAPILWAELTTAIRPDPWGRYTVTLGVDGKSLAVKGYIGFGLPADLRKALRQDSQVDTVVFDSLGGRSHAGLVIGKLLDEGRYNTRVDRVCASACTIAFLGGHSRLVGVHAKLGFHHPKFLDGLELAIQNGAVEREKGFVWSRGVSSAFIDKIYETSFDKIYIPTMDELSDGHVLTGIVDNGDVISLSDYHARYGN